MPDAEELVSSTLTNAMITAGERALIQAGVSAMFDVKNRRAVAWLKDNALIHATSIVATMKAEAASLIVSGIRNGKSMVDIADDITSMVKEQSGWRALRIARTEVISGYAEGSLEGYRQSGVVKMKKWLTAGDERVDGGDMSGACATNEAAGEIPLEQIFPSGDVAPPNHPNCRCSLVPVVD